MATPRRQLLAGLLSAAVLTVTACSSGGSSGDPGGATSGANGANGATRSVENIDGTAVRVPEHPTRIVTLSEPTTDAVLALGLRPIGVVSGRGQSTVSNYLADRARGIPILGGIAQPNYEAIGAAKPDLILVDGTSINNNAEAIETLRHIAPTVYTGYAGGDWRANLKTVATAVGEPAKGTQLLADYDERVRSLAERLAKAGYATKTFSIVRWQGNSASLVLLELPPGEALTDLGLKRPPSQNHRGRGHSEPVSLENLGTIDADYMFFGTLGGSSVGNPDAGGSADTAAARAALTQAEKTPGFARLTAAREGHIIPVDGSVWTSTGGPILMNDIVDDVQKALLDR